MINIKAKIKKFRKVFVVILIPFVAYGLWRVYQGMVVNEIHAVDPLQISYNGSAPPDPMFIVLNMLPGDEEEKTFVVKNTIEDAFDVEMTAFKTDEEKNFAQILEVEIERLSDASIIFSGILQNLFDSPPIPLGNFPGESEESYRVKVKFPASAGNEYQEALVVFDINWRAEIPDNLIPPECEHLAAKIVNVVEGTDGNDKIFATFKSDLILSYDGDDWIHASSGDDCIVTGNGNNYVEAGSGDDVIIGGDGDDEFWGGSGNDIIYGGGGNDKIYGGSGNDIIFGGPGDDFIDGGSGNDLLYGEEGNDTIRGGSDDDFLDGGPGVNNLHGNSGNDTCTNGAVYNSCETIIP